MRWLGLLAALLGCAPDQAGDPARVDPPRILAVRAEPAEAAPGEPVTLTALVGAPDEPTALAWAWCAVGRAVAESRLAAPACLEGRAEALTPLTGGVTLTATVPDDACAIFGSTPPPPTADARPLRPVDPDATGGWYQPVRVALDAAVTLGRVRLRCALPGAPAEVARRFATEAIPNTNPHVRRVGDATRQAAVGQPIELAVTLVDPPERYLRYDPATGALTTRVERITVRWYTSAGAIEPSGTAARWIADAPGDALVWAVVRDDRGGVGWQTWQLTVE